MRDNDDYMVMSRFDTPIIAPEPTHAGNTLATLVDTVVIMQTILDQQVDAMATMSNSIHTLQRDIKKLSQTSTFNSKMSLIEVSKSKRLTQHISETGCCTTEYK